MGTPQTPQVWERMQLVGPHSGSVLELRNPVHAIGNFFWSMLEENRVLQQQLMGLLDEIPGSQQMNLTVIRNARSSKDGRGKLWVNRNSPVAVTIATETTPAEFLVLAGERTDSVLFFRGDEGVLQLLRNALTNKSNQVMDLLCDTWVPNTHAEREQLMRRKPHEIPQDCVAHPDHPLARRFIVALSEYAKLKSEVCTRGINSMILTVFPQVGENLELCRHHWCTIQGLITTDGKIDKELLSIRLEEVTALEAVASEIRAAEAAEEGPSDEEADQSINKMVHYEPKSDRIIGSAVAEEENIVHTPPSVSNSLAAALFGSVQKSHEVDPILQDLQNQLQKAKLFEGEVQVLLVQQQQNLSLAHAKVDELEQQLLTAREEVQTLQGAVEKSGLDLEQSWVQQAQLQSKIAEIEATVVPQLSPDQIQQLDSLIAEFTRIRNHQK